LNTFTTVAPDHRIAQLQAGAGIAAFRPHRSPIGRDFFFVSGDLKVSGYR
jgi:hypothetical protein